jgi:hypothetical protein
MSICADSLAEHGAEGRNGGDVRLGELQETFVGSSPHNWIRSPQSQGVDATEVAAEIALRLAEAGHISGDKSLDWWCNVIAEIIRKHQQSEQGEKRE